MSHLEIEPAPVGAGCSNPIIGGGGVLVYPGIQSPNFSQANQTGWAILKNGNAFFFNIQALGQILTNAGITVGQSGSEVMLNPNASSAFDVTTAIAGVLQAVMQLITTDGSEVLPGTIGGVILGSGAAAKMATAVTSPIGASSGAALVLEAENDGGTDTPVITVGSTSSPDRSTMVFTPAMTISPYALLLYGASSGTTVVTKIAGSGTIPVPAGVTTAKAECWAGGQPGGASGGLLAGGGGGGGGEYAAEPALAVTGGGTVAYSAGAAGQNSTLTGTSVTVTAHAGTAGGSGGSGGAAGTGGTGSTNTVHFNGGAGGAAPAGGGGGGGGSSAGTSSAGNPGHPASGVTGGAGGAAPASGGAGGAGGTSTLAGHAGSAPGGGGGGAGGNAAAGAGSAGQVRVTYSTGVPPILMSIAAAAGTDQFGNAIPAGLFLASQSAQLGMAWLRPSGDTSGATDAGAINGALAAGRPVHLLPGTYYINASINVPASGSLTGPLAAINTTPGASDVMPAIIKLVSGSNGVHMINITGNNAYVGNLELDGNKAGQASGFGNGILYQNQFFAKFENLFIHDQFFRGIDCVNGSAAQIVNCSITGNADIGIFGDTSSNDLHISDCQVGRNGSEGINLGGFVAHITDNDIFNNTNNGIKLVGGRGHIVTGNGIDHNGQNGLAIAPPAATAMGSISVVGNTFHSNGQTTNNTYSNINISNPGGGSTIDGVTIQGNTFWLDGGITNLVAWHIFYSGTVIAKAHGNQFQAASSATGTISAASQAKDANETG